MDLDNEDRWERILSSTMFVIWSTLYATTPSQLVFDRETFFNIKQETNWQFMK